MGRHNSIQEDEIVFTPKLTLKDIGLSIAILGAATLVGFFFDQCGYSGANIILVYIIGVLTNSILTAWPGYSLISSFISVLVFNFLFTEPRFTLMAYDKDYPITFLVMFLVAVLASSMTIRLKRQAKESARASLLAEKEQLRANLLRSISHDLRTPLTSISGNASNLITNESAFDEATKMQMYTDIYDDSMWLNNMVENLLSITKIEDGKFSLHMTAEDVDEVITEAVKHVKSLRKQHEIKIVKSDELLLAVMDSRLITQVLINLLDNAIKHTPSDSLVTVISRKNGDWIEVSVTDDGEGVSDDMKEHIFEMFYTGKKQIADNRRSLGLGLALCRSIIDIHGGQITVADHQPHGAVFQFSLKAYDSNLCSTTD